MDRHVFFHAFKGFFCLSSLNSIQGSLPPLPPAAPRNGNKNNNSRSTNNSNSNLNQKTIIKNILKLLNVNFHLISCIGDGLVSSPRLDAESENVHFCLSIGQLGKLLGRSRQRQALIFCRADNTTQVVSQLSSSIIKPQAGIHHVVVYFVFRADVHHIQVRQLIPCRYDSKVRKLILCDICLLLLLTQLCRLHLTI